MLICGVLTLAAPVPLRIRLGQVGTAVQACKRVHGVAACVRDEWEGEEGMLNLRSY